MKRKQKERVFTTHLLSSLHTHPIVETRGKPPRPLPSLRHQPHQPRQTRGTHLQELLREMREPLSRLTRSVLVRANLTRLVLARKLLRLLQK